MRSPFNLAVCRRALLCLLGTVLLFEFVAGMGLDAAEPNRPPEHEGTRRMVQRLAGIARNARASDISFYSNLRVDALAARLPEVNDPGQRLDLRVKLAGELLNAGRSEEALEIYNACARESAGLGFSMGPEASRRFEMRRAVCHLRIGEQENCLHHHNTESCLFPIRGNGVHPLRRGSEGAVQLLNRSCKSTLTIWQPDGF